MSKTAPTLSTYPSQLQAMAKAAIEKKSIFPIQIPFPSSKAAMDFRVTFYKFRRALRLLSEQKTPDSDTYLLLSGAEAIQSPRIAATPDAADGKSYLCIFALTANTTANLVGLSALDSILSQEALTESTTDLMDYTPKPQPEIFNDSTKLALHKGLTYQIPACELTLTQSELPPEKLGLLLANGLISLTLPLSDYIIAGDSLP